ncbi:unnamed protein product [Rotaria magnacalcarata]|uniref:Coiled-coil domain-containing protein n=5 Tax=Rotaria magnacalcarata TaxID=392030 RepID=A0A816Q2B0_9BILA|nr:unnamed protein product [Rotaria magnacalcarata]CAF2062161.1 unnamed protein product [Rotaria magnacalcarata]CAF3718519.1 unnamed protein product [Rotaria magnacalcarata]CAF3740154.1 unnamed protein product [Rotaria magnacalcarata]
MTNYTDLNQTILSSLRSGDEQSSDDEIKTLFSSSPENADADIDTTLASPRYLASNVQAVYRELALIRQRLAQENERLKKKSNLLNQWEERMRETIEHGWQAHKEKFDTEINVYKEKLSQMTKDFKRTNETLQLLREQNSELKRNLNDLRETNEKLVEKTKQAEKRSENLIRLNQISEQKIKELEKTIEINKKPPIANHNEQPTKITENTSCCRNTSDGERCYEHHSSASSPTTISKTPSIASTDSLIFLFNWLSDITQTTLTEWPSSTAVTSDAIERYSKLLSILADQSSFCLHKNHSNLILSYLKLVYFSLITIECPTTSGQTRHLYSCSYRRLCEQILKCEKNQERPHLFDDNEPLIRLYACLIVLLTCNKIIDLIACYNQLRLDLNSKPFIDIFVQNYGIVSLYRWLRPPSHHKRLIFDTIDLLLLLCTDSKSLRPFLKQLSNDTWFHLLYQLTQQCNDGLGSSTNLSNIQLLLTPTFDLKTMEKLGILFEKLSELTENRRLFSKYNFLYIFKEWKQKFVNDSPFLVLNMKSTLLNLEQ